MAISVKCNGFDVVCDTPAEAQKVIEHFGKGKTQQGQAATIIRHNAASSQKESKGTYVAQMIDTLKAQGPLSTGQLLRKTFGQLEVTVYRNRAGLLYALERSGRLRKDENKQWHLVQSKPAKAKLPKTKYVANSPTVQGRIENLLAKEGPMDTGSIVERICGTTLVKKTRSYRNALARLKNRGDIRKNSEDKWVLV